MAAGAAAAGGGLLSGAGLSLISLEGVAGSVCSGGADSGVFFAVSTALFVSCGSILNKMHHFSGSRKAVSSCDSVDLQIPLCQNRCPTESPLGGALCCV